MIAKIPDLQKILAVLRNGKIDQRIEAIDILAADQFLSFRIEQGQRGIEGRTGTKGVHIKNQSLVPLRLEAVKVTLCGLANDGVDRRGQIHQLRVVGVMVAAGFDELAKEIHVEDHGLGNAVGRSHAKFARAQRRVRRGRDADTQSFLVVVRRANPAATALQVGASSGRRRIGGRESAVTTEEEGVDLR